MSQHEAEAVNNEACELRRSSRETKPTEKGLWWQIETLQKNFRRAISSWKSFSTKIEVLLSDTTDTNRIRENRDILLETTRQITSIYKQVVHLLEQENIRSSEHSHLLGDIEADLNQRYDSFEVENSELLKRITNRLQELESDNLDTKSKRSFISRSHHSSRSSSHRSNYSERSQTASRAAELKAKLKYLDLESKAQLELDKIKTIRELEATEAKLDVIDKGSHKSELDDLKRSLPEANIMDRFLQQARSEVETHDNIKTDNLYLKGTFPKSNVAGPDQVYNVPVSTSSDMLASQPVGNLFLPLVSQSVPVVRQSVSMAEQPVLSTSQPVPFVDQLVMQSVPASRFNPTAREFVPLRNDFLFSNRDRTPASANPSQQTNTQNESGTIHPEQLVNLAKSFAEQVSLSRLPPPEPPVFNGDPSKYAAWKVSFETLIESRKIPLLERIHYLRRYVGDSVREVIENFFLVVSDDSYIEAKRLLDQRYGDPFVVGNAYRDKLERWPKISPRDTVGLRKFSDFIKQCLSAMKTIGNLNVLNDDRENRKIIAKLPDWIITRWGRVVAQHKAEFSTFPSFQKFSTFLEQEATIANDPITSLNSLKIEAPTRSNEATTRVTRRSAFATEVSARPNPKSSANKTCFFCNETGHSVGVCVPYLALPIQERKDYAKKKGLCFGCLNSGHLSKHCKKRATCNVCKKAHPTAFHGDTQVRNKESRPEHKSNDTDKVLHTSSTGAVLMSTSESCGKSSMIVPVYVAHKDNPHDERLVYALLDTQSDTTFILDDTRRALGLKGTDVKLSLSTMHTENAIFDSSKIKGLIVRGYDSDLKLELPIAYTRDIMPANRSHIPTREMAMRWTNLEVIADKLMPLSDCEIGLLIGYNVARALTPREVIPPLGNGPYAQRTDLGWGIVGIVDHSSVDDCCEIYSHRIMIFEVQKDLSKSDENSDEVLISFGSHTKEINPLEIAKMMEIDFSDRYVDEPPISRQDRRFITILEKGIQKVNGRYEMPLPFKNDEPELPNNRALALQRFGSLRKRLQRDDRYRDDYFKGMNDLIDKGFVERVESANDDNRKVWFIPHHGVYHPLKPDKIRIVFDCSAKYNGVSLNDNLLQGPDLTNSLLGVLCRFREEQIAFVCDIEQMFLQFMVKYEHRDYLRFLWWDDYRDLSKEPVEYRMNRHLFGATSSPGCANFALKQIATDNEAKFGSENADFIRNDFYVDDGLKSVNTVESAINLVSKSIEMCKTGGLRLHKFLSNSMPVLNYISPDDRASEARSIDLLNELPTTKTLGVQWCIESDSFQFRIILNDKPFTRRGVLSTLSSIYDPLGFIAPIVLNGKRILQDSCFEQTDWDDPLNESLLQRWDHWRNDILNLKDIEISRCLKPIEFGNVVTCELHHFSDASTKGYGQCSYIRLIDDHGRTHCSLLIGKARVVPRKQMTIPRLELSAALVSVRISTFLKRELSFDPVEWFWTDSNVVLGYLSNENRRFHVFVANRVQQIRQKSEPEQWKHVETNLNPADVASRGATTDELKRSNWFTGPDFLWTTTSFEPDKNKPVCEQSDPEVKNVKVLSTHFTSSTSELGSILERIEYFSDWMRAKRAIAICLNFKNALHYRTVISECSYVNVENLRQAELEIIRQVQKVAFKDETEVLRKMKLNESDTRQFARERNETMKHTSSLYKLDPYIDSDGIVRIGGRLRRANLDCNLKHPVILPKQSHVTNLVIRYCHELCKHQGRGLTTNMIRSCGFWIIGCSSAVSKIVSGCVTCRRLRGKTMVQKMADLPKDRIEPQPPFTYCGVDLFGPWLIKENRKELKRYGVLFTCLSSRAIHLETANSLDTSSFINALRRFISIRGPVRVLRSDQGTNFVGAAREFREGFSEMDVERIKHYLMDNNCDFKMNVPSASHMGGVWERQIRSVRNILSTLLNQLGTQLDDESLRTFMCETAAIVNSRPLTMGNLNDPLSDEPLTPNHLLTMKSNIILPPPGEFSHGDLYSRKRWRRTQYLANQFWDRWRKEFLSNLQARQKWISKTRNMCVGDIVMIKDENLSRNEWRLGRLVKTYVDEDGLVRKARIALGTPELNNKGIRTVAITELERPIHKLVLIRETEEFSAEEP